MIIEGVVDRWLPGEINKGTPWKDILVRHPDHANFDDLRVLVVALGKRSPDDARAAIEAALRDTD